MNDRIILGEAFKQRWSNVSQNEADLVADAMLAAIANAGRIIIDKEPITKVRDARANFYRDRSKRHKIEEAERNLIQSLIMELK